MLASAKDRRQTLRIKKNKSCLLNESVISLDISVLETLPAFVWVEVEAATAQVDGAREVLGVAEAASGLAPPLHDGVDASGTRSEGADAACIDRPSRLHMDGWKT
jgi:hypothetical protein